VKESNAELREGVLFEFFIFLYCGFDVGGVVGAVDSRIDEVSLFAFSEKFSDKFESGILLVWFYPFGDDFAASGRILFYSGDVEVCKGSHSERSWDWCCGHDKAVGGEVFSYGGSLVNTEFMLFVDDGKSEVFEINVFAEQCYGADDDVDFSIGDFLGELFSFCRGCGAGDKSDGDLTVFEESGEALIMLRCEYFSGGHNGDLSFVCDSQQSGIEGNDSFAGAYITLKQAVHRFCLLHIANDFRDDFVLVIGECEGKSFSYAQVDLVGECHSWGGCGIFDV